MLKIKKGDTIRVQVGKDKGKEAKVERVFPQGLVKAVGVNEYKRHRKGQGEGKLGEIVTLNRPLAMAKVAVVCPKCKQATRIGFRFEGDKKVRVCRKCDASI